MVLRGLSTRVILAKVAEYQKWGRPPTRGSLRLSRWLSMSPHTRPGAPRPSASPSTTVYVRLSLKVWMCQPCRRARPGLLGAGRPSKSGGGCDDLPAQLLRLHVGSAVMQARPDAGLDHLLERLREPVEVAQLAREAAARHVEPDLSLAEEHLQHPEHRAVETEVFRRVLRARRGEERRPRRVRLGLRVAVLVRPLDRLPGPSSVRNCDELFSRNGRTPPTHGVGSSIGRKRRVRAARHVDLAADREVTVATAEADFGAEPSEKMAAQRRARYLAQVRAGWTPAHWRGDPRLAS
jgi:hypothetical protein